MVMAGIGIYYSVSDQGYINPGISINSFSSNTDTYVNDSMAIPVFYAHVDSSKTTEYQLCVNGQVIGQGIVTGKANITAPDSLYQFGLIEDTLGTPGLHTVTFSILYNSFKTSKSVSVFTFPNEQFNVSHYYIDTGISDVISASNPVDNISIDGHAGGTYTFLPTSNGTYNLSYGMSYKNFHYTGNAVEIHVFNKPVPVNIYYNDYSYCSFSDSSCFDLNMNVTGGDTVGEYVSHSLNYSIYVNGTYYTTVSSSDYLEARNISYYMDLNGQGPFDIYYIIGDRYYNDSASKTIEVP